MSGTDSQQPADAAVSVRVSDDGQAADLQFGGVWRQHSAIAKSSAALLIELAALPKPLRLIRLQADEAADWDSRLPAYALQVLDWCRANGVEADVSGLPPGVQKLLALAQAVPGRGSGRAGAPSPWLAAFGKAVLAGVGDAGSLVRFVGEAALAFAALLRGRARFRSADLALCLQDCGPSALPIVTLISLLVGMILAFVGAVQLSMFGAQVYIANLVSLGTLREMGALMTAIILSGRTGAAYAAQLGTMNVNSEIDALRTMGIDPMEFLVLPRLLALVLMMPLLTLYANLMGIAGGALVTVGAFDVSLVQYYNGTVRAVQLSDFAIGLFKSLVFAALIALAGCMRGMRCGRSAAAVGDAATAAVVNSVVYIVVADALITLICNRMGW